jgi:hypothetical protein
MHQGFKWKLIEIKLQALHTWEKSIVWCDRPNPRPCSQQSGLIQF